MGILRKIAGYTGVPQTFKAVKGGVRNVEDWAEDVWTVDQEHDIGK